MGGREPVRDPRQEGARLVEEASRWLLDAIPNTGDRLSVNRIPEIVEPVALKASDRERTLDLRRRPASTGINLLPVMFESGRQDSITEEALRIMVTGFAAELRRACEESREEELLRKWTVAATVVREQVVGMLVSAGGESVGVRGVSLDWDAYTVQAMFRNCGFPRPPEY